MRDDIGYGVGYLPTCNFTQAPHQMNRMTWARIPCFSFVLGGHVCILELANGPQVLEDIHFCARSAVKQLRFLLNTQS
jgi:hypothetical protein